MKITPLALGHVTLPESHPRAVEGTCPIIAHTIEHPDGLVVVDTGPDVGHEVIDELYRPEVCSIIDALNLAGFDEREVTAVVNSHLHFDHCGQNHRLDSAPVWVTAAEVTAAAEPFYTVPEWAVIDDARLRVSTDGVEIAENVRLLHTPGHTPGHQSVAVESPDGVAIIAGQACYSCAEFASNGPTETDMHDETWLDAGRESVARLAALKPIEVHFSHDPTVYRPGPSTT